MEFIFVLAIGAFIIFSYPFFLSKRIKKLEERVRQLESGEVKSYDSTPQVALMYPDMNTDRLTAIPLAREVDNIYVDNFKPNAFVAWVKEDFFVKLGAFLLLLALGWFVSYAFMNNWIGPAGRIFLGLLLGVIFFGLGIWRIRTHAHQGGIFTAVGATTVMMTLFAAREIYDFFTPTSALVVMFMTVVFVAFVSVRYERQALALAGLVLASIAPFLTNLPAPDITERFMYLLVVILGTLWVVAITGWTRLTLASLIIAFCYSLPFLSGWLSSADRDIAVIFSFIFVSLFFVANMISIIRRTDTKHMPNHSLTALGSAIFLFIWIQEAVSSDLQSLLYVAWALVFSVGAYLVHYYSHNRIAFFLYGGTGIALLAAATAAELSGPVLTIAYLFEVSAIVLGALALRANQNLVSKLCWLYIVPVTMSLESIDSREWRDSIFHQDFVVVSLAVAILLLVGLTIYVKQKERGVEDQGRSALVMIISGFVYLTIWVWLVMHALFGNEGTMFSLFIYTVNGIALYIQSKHNENKYYHYAGVGLIGFVVARLMLVDVWDMELVERIITFCIVGVLLMSTAFLRKGSKDKVEEVNHQEL